jgi:prepilin-type N-terminal cleavage/methylation domain-containing protein
MRWYYSLEKLYSEQGFTLIEVLVALAIMGVVLAASTSSFITHIRANYSAEIVFEGEQAAQSVIDELRYIDVASLPISGTDVPRSVTMNALRDFEVYVTYCPEESFCTSDMVRHLRVRAEYRGEAVYETNTVFTQFEKGAGSSEASESSAGGSSSSTSAPSPSPSPTPSQGSSSGGGKKKKKRCKFWGC